MRTYDIISLPPKAQDLTGKIFWRWRVVSFAGGVKRKPKGYNLYWVCRCICGAVKQVAGGSLTYGTNKSCGCLKREKVISRSTKHGHCLASGCSKAYRAWRGMRSRCQNENDARYQDYGGRGIYVCQRWRSFEHFFSDIGEPPNVEYSIDRVDNDGPYSPDNCRWATRMEQAQNTRKNVFLTHNGKTLCLLEWARVMGLSSGTLYSRYQRGWPLVDVLSKKKFPKRRHPATQRQFWKAKPTCMGDLIRKKGPSLR